MTAEGDDVEPETVTIRECDRPYRFAADTSVGEGVWHIRFQLSEDNDATVLVFAQTVGSDPLGSIGPGWEYYLDRLGVVIADGDVDSVDWDAYYPSMSDYYASLA